LGGRSADQLRLRPHGAVLRHRELCPAACWRCQGVRHADRAIAALLHGGQSQDGSIARCFFVGCVHCSGQRGARMKRREFITLLGGAATAWPVAARAQQRERMRGIGALIGSTANDAEGQARIAAVLQGLQELGWTVGRNLRIDIRWTGGNPADTRKYAAELVALAPDVILASGSSTMRPLLEATHTVPIVFTVVADPVGGGFVESLARPGRNVTGFTPFYYGMAVKSLAV